MKRKIEFRPVTPQDYPAIVQLVPTQDELHLVYPRGTHPFDVEQLSELASIRKELTVAVLDDQIIGFANLYDIEPDRWAFVGNVVVSRAQRGFGLGRMLVSHMIRIAFEKYVLSEVRLSVFSENSPALLLYTSMQFRPYAVEERLHPSGRRVALIHMSLGRDRFLQG